MPLQRKPHRKKQNILMTLVSAFFIVLFISAILIGGVVVFIVRDAVAEVDKEEINLDWTFSENSRVLDSEGNLLTSEIGETMRTVVEYEEISKDMINALVAIEDKTFWEHEGFNYVRLLGAAREALVSDGTPSGTSTLTQQLARNLYLFDRRTEQTIKRKIQEAYYAMQLEEKVSKEDIITAYLNMAFLGQSADGIQAAAQIYFSKDASDLNYIEGAMLATIPSSPSYYQPMYTVNKNEYTSDMQIVGNRNVSQYFIYNPNIRSRYELVLQQMLEQEYITQAQYDAGMNTDLSEVLNPQELSVQNIGSYFVDMTINQVVDDLAKARDITEEEARNVLNTAGLTIHSTLDVTIQKTMERTINDTGAPMEFNLATQSQIRRMQSLNGLEATGQMNPESWQILIDRGYFSSSVVDRTFELDQEDTLIYQLKSAMTNEGYIAGYERIPGVNADFENGNMILDDKPVLLNYRSHFDEDDNFYLPPDTYHMNESGEVVIHDGPILNIEANEDNVATYVGIEGMYDFPDNSAGSTYTGTRNLPYFLRYSGARFNINPELLRVDAENNLILSASLNDGQNIRTSELGSLILDSSLITPHSAPVIQPQITASVIEPHTGYVRGVIGGRGVMGNMLFNRATAPQDTGSAIKPISVYGPGIDSGAMTAATVFDDVPTFKYLDGDDPWPMNVTLSWVGRQGVRDAIIESTNVIAVEALNKLGIERSVEYLEKNGITTLVGDDHSYSPLALGGLTYGIPPIEMASAFSTIANDGQHIPYKTYTKVVDNNGNVVLDNTNPTGETVFSPAANYILRDILLDNIDVNSWTGVARIRDSNRGIPTFGKTGTSNSRQSVSFAGSTPYYSSYVWIGCDLLFPLDEGSISAAYVFKDMMIPIHEGLEDKSFSERPDNVVSATIDGASGLLPGPLSYSDPRGSQVRDELFVSGTVPTEYDDAHEVVTVCTASGKLVGPYCPEHTIGSKVVLTRIDPDVNLSDYTHKISDHWATLGPGEVCDVHTSPQPQTTEPEAPTNPEVPITPPSPETPVDPTPDPTPQPPQSPTEP